MTTIAEAVYTKLKSSDSIFILVGNRIYPTLAEQNVKNPFITYNRVSQIREKALINDTDITHAVFEISAWSDSIDEANQVANEVRVNLQRFKGTVSGLTILDCYINNDIELYDPDTKLYQAVQDWEIWYRE